MALKWVREYKDRRFAWGTYDGLTRLLCNRVDSYLLSRVSVFLSRDGFGLSWISKPPQKHSLIERRKMGYSISSHFYESLFYEICWVLLCGLVLCGCFCGKCWFFGH